MISSIPLVATLLASISVTSAHFTLDYPTSRGFDDDNEPQFCGGFNSVQNPRQPFPLSQGPVWIDSHHQAATVDAFLSVNPNPTSFNDFNTTSNGTAIPMVTKFFQIKSPGEFCWNVSMADLGIGLTNGSLVTLQIQYDGGDGTLYQCTDLVLLSDFTPPADRRCSVDATTNPTATVSAPASSGASTGPSASAASSAAATTSGAARKSVEAKGWSVFGAALLGLTML